jgi:hypothetical protein
MDSLSVLSLSGARGQGIGTGATNKRREFSPESLILRPCAYRHRATGRSRNTVHSVPFASRRILRRRPDSRAERSGSAVAKNVPSALNLAADSLMIAVREDIAMAFFKLELSPVERFESALKEKQAARQKLADRLSIAETLLGEKRAAAERLAVSGAANAQLDRADASMRAVEERAKTLRAALGREPINLPG